MYTLKKPISSTASNYPTSARSPLHETTRFFVRNTDKQTFPRHSGDASSRKTLLGAFVYDICGRLLRKTIGRKREASIAKENREKCTVYDHFAAFVASVSPFPRRMQPRQDASNICLFLRHIRPIYFGL